MYYVEYVHNKCTIVQQVQKLEAFSEKKTVLILQDWGSY